MCEPPLPRKPRERIKRNPLIFQLSRLKWEADFYNLDMIISVGYRVKSQVATRFRMWATQRLKEYIIKGFVLDDERLKNPNQPFDYFEELTRRIQDIRTSERRFYQKITDIYATSIDYDPTQDISLTFFKTVQNKMHWAITGQTAAEIIYSRVDATKPHAGLTSWRGTDVRKTDVTIARNYLAEDELRALNNLAEQYLIFAEGQAMRRIPMHMTDWIQKLDAFLNINDREILTHAGKISHELAQQRAEAEYAQYHQSQLDKKVLAGSDFDAWPKNGHTTGNNHEHDPPRQPPAGRTLRATRHQHRQGDKAAGYRARVRVQGQAQWHL
jgi:hypothetical protein